jgi:hypothetical protein
MKNKNLMYLGVAVAAYLLFFQRKSMAGVGMIMQYKDPDAAREIELYAENDGDLYRQRRRPILINLSKKHKKGMYDVNKAAKLWMYYIEDAMKKYNKEFGSGNWAKLLTVHDRKVLAQQLAQETLEEFNLGNYTEF